MVGNSHDGVEFDGVTATDVTFKGDIITANGDDGVFIDDSDTSDGFVSSLTDFAIQELLSGRGSEFDGGSFAGNGGAGFDGADSTFTGVAFLNSFFNENGFDGILFDTSTIKSGTVTFDDGTPECSPPASRSGSQTVGNSESGILVFDSIVADVTLHGRHDRREHRERGLRLR